MKKISGAFLIVTLHAVLVVGQNGVLECGCFQTVSDSRPNSTSFEDSMSTCVYRCKIEPTCVAVAFSEVNGKCQLHNKETVTVDPASWHSDSSCSTGVKAEAGMRLFLFQWRSGKTYDCDYLFKSGALLGSGYTTIDIRGATMAVYCSISADSTYALTYMDVGGAAVDSVVGTVAFNRVRLDVHPCMVNVDTTDILESDDPNSGIEIGVVSSCSSSRTHSFELQNTPFRFVTGWHEKIVVDGTPATEEDPNEGWADWQNVSASYTSECTTRWMLTNVDLVNEFGYQQMIPLVFNQR